MTWPVQAIQYGSYDWLKRWLGVYFNFGADFNTWTHEQAGRAESCIESGLSQFYFPPVIEKEPYEWTFLRPVATLALTAGEYAYDLPADFGMVIDEITFSLDDREDRIELVPGGQIRAQRAGADLSGAPKYCTIRPKAADPSAQQVWEIAFYPTPDKAYTVEYWYYRIPQVGPEVVMPLGSPQHAEAIVASCISIAELIRDGGRGVMHERFMERLSAAVALDQRSSRKRIPQ